MMITENVLNNNTIKKKAFHFSYRKLHTGKLMFSSISKTEIIMEMIYDLVLYCQFKIIYLHIMRIKTTVV